jgi:hypothetical protein
MATAAILKGTTVYALRYTTVESKKYNLVVDGVFFQTKHMRG